MERPDSSMSYNGGVSLRGHRRHPSSPETPTAMSLLPYNLLADGRGPPSRGVASQEHHERDAARALSAMQRRARGDDRESLHRTPTELTAFIVSGAAVPVETSQEFNRRIRRNTSAASSDITPLYYEPPRRITYNSRDMSLAPIQGRFQRTIACASPPANTLGNSIAFVNVEMRDPQIFLQLSPGSLPTVEQVFENLPFFEPCRAAASSNAGVLRINNIPYTSPRSEVSAFVGRNVQILAQPAGSPYYAVHVIMERHTGKTMDAFIEFSKISDAVAVHNEFKKRISLGRHPKLGDREIAVSISSQEDLMGELFPRARNVYFVGGSPHVLEMDEFYYRNVKAAGFAGFLQNEEIIHMVKHAETPNRVSIPSTPFLNYFQSTDSCQVPLRPALLHADIRVHDLNHPQISMVCTRVRPHGPASCTFRRCVRLYASPCGVPHTHPARTYRRSDQAYARTSPGACGGHLDMPRILREAEAQGGPPPPPQSLRTHGQWKARQHQTRR
nr:hypothetical protein CFP56_24595 [Quercus suber]